MGIKLGTEGGIELGNHKRNVKSLNMSKLQCQYNAMKKLVPFSNSWIVEVKT